MSLVLPLYAAYDHQQFVCLSLSDLDIDIDAELENQLADKSCRDSYMGVSSPIAPFSRRRPLDELLKETRHGRQVTDCIRLDFSQQAT